MNASGRHGWRPPRKVTAAQKGAGSKPIKRRHLGCLAQCDYEPLEAERRRSAALELGFGFSHNRVPSPQRLRSRRLIATGRRIRGKTAPHPAQVAAPAVDLFSIHLRQAQEPAQLVDVLVAQVFGSHSHAATLPRPVDPNRFFAAEV
jgi:hypothetical protein